MITNEEVATRLEDSPFPRVTREGIQDKIHSVRYFNDDTLTIAVLTLFNDFKVVGSAACVDPGNYDEAIGQRLAFEDGVRQIWALEGYVLRSRIFERESQA